MLGWSSVGIPKGAIPKDDSPKAETAVVLYTLGTVRRLLLRSGTIRGSRGRARHNGSSHCGVLKLKPSTLSLRGAAVGLSQVPPGASSMSHPTLRQSTALEYCMVPRPLM